MTGPNRLTRPGMRWGSARLRVPLLVVLCWLASVTPALATILDEPESLTEGSDGVVRVHFDVRIQYQRHAPTGSADLVEVFFQIIGTNLTLAPGVEEVVRTPEHGRVPAVTISYPIQPQPGNVAPIKKIILRFSRKVTFRVRGGPTDQSIDGVFPGLAGVAPPRCPAPPTRSAAAAACAAARSGGANNRGRTAGTRGARHRDRQAGARAAGSGQGSAGRGQERGGDQPAEPAAAAAAEQVFAGRPGADRRGARAGRSERAGPQGVRAVPEAVPPRRGRHPRSAAVGEPGAAACPGVVGGHHRACGAAAGTEVRTDRQLVAVLLRRPDAGEHDVPEYPDHGQSADAELDHP